MSVVEQARDLLKGRLTDLDSEKKQVERALDALNGRRRGPGRPRALGTGSSPTKTRSSSRRGGGRREEAVKLIEKNPGITASEIAKRMKIKPNYLYRVLGELEKEGRVKKTGRKYDPAS